MRRALLLAMLAISPTAEADDEGSVAVGMAWTSRELTFDSSPDLEDPPSSYHDSLEPSLVVDASLFPLPMLGLELAYQVPRTGTATVNYVDDQMTPARASLTTSASRLSVGPVYRHAIDPTLVVGGKLLYSTQRFYIAQTYGPNLRTDVPDVHYEMIEPTAFVTYRVGAVTLDATVAFALVYASGGISSHGLAGYGTTTGTGLEATAGARFHVTSSLDVRGAVQLEQIRLAFQGDPSSLSSTRDQDLDQDVFGARDTYLGLSLMLGYTL